VRLKGDQAAPLDCLVVPRFARKQREPGDGMSDEQVDQNTAVIDEFRSNDGAVGGPFDGVPLLLLHHTGARSGPADVTPLSCLAVGDGWVVAGGNGGQPTNPAWYFNLLAQPRTTVEFGSATYEVTARVAEGAERDALVARFRAESPFYPGIEKATSRTVPLVVLEP
jgi:deazaflavin-dependent oxidoreductase (nitroreductase family)